MLKTREPFHEKMSSKTTPSGETRWYSTSKSVVVGRDGDVIGLTGVTHDITQRKRNEEETPQEPQPVVERRVRHVGRAGHVRRRRHPDVLQRAISRDLRIDRQHFVCPACHLRTILRGRCRDRGSRSDIPARRGTRAWIDHVIATVHDTTEREVQLKNGRWIRDPNPPFRAMAFRHGHGFRHHPGQTGAGSALDPDRPAQIACRHRRADRPAEQAGVR